MPHPSAHVKPLTIQSMAVFYSIVLLLIMGNYRKNLANAEYMLTEENGKGEHIEKIVDMYGHPLWNKCTLVKDYNPMDQCFRQPGFPHIMSFAIAVQMGPITFNAGIGTTVCYSGQLNKFNNYNGMVPTAPFRLVNIEGNPVREICEYIRTKCQEKTWKGGCPEDKNLRSPWHGIQFKQKEADMNILEIHMSTTDKSFDIPISNLTDGWLILKLTRWNSLVTTLATKFGTGYHTEKENRNHLKEKGLIKEQANYELLKTFRTRVGNGSTLQKYMGPWALGADILPSTGQEPINFFVIRSNCSELNISFISPTEIASKLQPFKREPITEKVKETSLKENHGIMLWARIHDNPTNFTIRMINRIWNYAPDCFGMGISVTFNGKESNIEFQNTSKIKDWTTANKTEEIKKLDIIKNKVLQFRPGELFILQLVSLKMTFNLSLNCGPYIEIKRDWELTGGNIFDIKVEGDLDIYKFELTAPDNVHIKKIATTHNNILKPGAGYFLRAELFKIWNINITFRQFNTDEKLYFPLVEFVATNLDEKFHVNEHRKHHNHTHVMRRVAIEKATAQDIDDTNGIFELHFVLVSLSKMEEAKCIIECGMKKLGGPCEKTCKDLEKTCFDNCRKNGTKCEKCDNGDDKNGTCPVNGCEEEKACLNECKVISNCDKCEEIAQENCVEGCKEKAKNSTQHALKFYLNDMLIYEYRLKNGTEIDQITAVADANDTTKVESFTWNPPIILKLNTNFDGNNKLHYILRGKVPKDATAFTIDFLYYTHALGKLTLDLEDSKCFVKDDGYDCQSFLHIETNYKENHTIFTSFLIDELTGKKLWQSNRTLDAHLFRQGEDFTIHIAWTLFNRVDRVFPVNITSAGETKFLKYQMPYCLGTDLCISQAPNFIQLMGDIILFGEPEVNIAVKETVQEQPANPPVLKMLHPNWNALANLTAGGKNGFIADRN